jgi:hypothetical protein
MPSGIRLKFELKYYLRFAVFCLFNYSIISAWFLSPLGIPNLSASVILAGYLSKKAREVLGYCVTTFL